MNTGSDVRTGCYRGTRMPDRCTIHNPEGVEIDWRLDLGRHSPTGPDWGYGGSGPTQAALSVLADYFRRHWDDGTADQLAVLYHRQFKTVLVSRLPDEWVLDVRAVASFVRSSNAEANGAVVSWTLWRATLTERDWLVAVGGRFIIRS